MKGLSWLRLLQTSFSTVTKRLSGERRVFRKFAQRHWVLRYAFCRWGLSGPRNEGEPCSILWGKKRPARFLSRRLGQYILGVQLSAFPQGLKSQGDQMGLNEPSTLWSSWGWGPAPSLRTRAVPCAADPCLLFYKANIKRS